MTSESGRLSEDLLRLLRVHPRETWPTHPNLGDLAGFWLARHRWFRGADAEIAGALAAGIDRRVDPRELAPRLAAGLQRFLGELEGHHHVEDHHYFPVFRRIEGGLAAGFDLLDADHDALHRAIGDIADAANAFLGEIRAGGGDPLGALARLEEVRARTSAGLLGHLDDEEDLVIPIILDRGEEAL